LHAIDDQQHDPADDQHDGDEHRRLEQHRLDEIVRQDADHCRRQERQQHAENEAARARIVRYRHGDTRQLDEIDGEDGEDGAELDQDLEGLARRADAEEMLGEQQVAGRRHGKKLGQPFDEAKQDHFPNRHRRPRIMCVRLVFLCGGED
jgi:hypothetical protein